MIFWNKKNETSTKEKKMIDIITETIEKSNQNENFKFTMKD